MEKQATIDNSGKVFSKHLQYRMKMMTTCFLWMMRFLVTSTTSSASRASSKCKPENGSEIVDTLHEMGNSRMQIQRAKQKLEILQKQEAQKEKEEER